MVTTDEIEAVADNARLVLEGREVAELQDDFEEILDSFEALDEVDTEGVEPALHPVEHGDRSRRDEAGECLSQEEALGNSQNTEKGYFKGPRSVE